MQTWGKKFLSEEKSN